MAPRTSSPPTTDPPAAGDEGRRVRRSDAERNRALVIAAATETFAEHGLDAPVPEIARRAGVGKGTVYRNFPTKEHLAVAVSVAHLRRYEALLAEAVAVDDPAAALGAIFAAAAEHLSRDWVLGQSVGVVADDPEVRETQARIREIIAATLARAQAAGAVRDDVTADDVTALVIGVARVLPPVNRGGRDELWRRLMTLALDALRPGGSTLTPGFADGDEARAAMRDARLRR
jgi:AcrR family transcriptional regulator